MRTFLDRLIPPNVDPIWDKIWEEAQGIVTECDLPALPQRPIRRARSDHVDHAGNYYSKEDYLKSVFLPRVCQKFCRYFGLMEEDSRPLLSEISLLTDIFRRGREDLPTDLLGLNNFLLPHSRVFLRIHQAIKIGITLSVTSELSDRSFSALRCIKTYWLY